jgi:glycine cleavage system H protein
MTVVNNCTLPDDLYFSVEDNVWIRDLGTGVVEIGMTDVAQTMAGSIIHCRPKKAGASVKKGKSIATVESGKWVGPVKAPFDGEIVERNDAVEKDAGLINRSPYKSGWIVRIKPADAGALGSMKKGAEAAPDFDAYMKANGVQGCIHCEGYEE